MKNFRENEKVYIGRTAAYYDLTDLKNEFIVL